jgi:hypothetical protein
MKIILFASSMIVLIVTASADAQVSRQAANAAIAGASMEQGRQWAINQRTNKNRSAAAERQLIIAQKQAVAQRWVNLKRNAMEKTMAGAMNAQRKKAERAETIAKVQQKYKEKKDGNPPATEPIRKP